MSDPASLRAAREEFDRDVREWAKELATLVASARGDSDEGWGMWAEWLYIKTLKWRDRLAVLSGEPPRRITVHDPSFHQASYYTGYAEGESSRQADYDAVLPELECWPDDVEVTPSSVAKLLTGLSRGEPPAPTPEPATCPKCAGVGGDAGGTACDLCGGTGRAPAALTAATPQPEDDPQLQSTLENYAAAHGDTRQSWGCFEKERAKAEAAHWAAISDWHRRTLGGEPNLERLVTPFAEVFAELGATWSLPINAAEAARRVAARLRSQHPEGST